MASSTPSVYDSSFLRRQKDKSLSTVDPTSAKRLRRRVYDHYGNLIPYAQDYVPRSYHPPDKPEDGNDKQEGSSTLNSREPVNQEEGAEEDGDDGIPKSRGRGRPMKRPIPYRGNDVESSNEDEARGFRTALESHKGLPSEVFLETIYHFTSRYYAQAGMLPNHRYQWKRGRKRWNSRESPNDPTELVYSSSSESGSSDADIGDDDNQGLGEEEEAQSKEDNEEEEQHIDMRNAFDGSALLAIAMLLQEQTKADIKHGYRAPSRTNDLDTQPTSHLLEELMNMTYMEPEGLPNVPPEAAGSKVE